MRLLVVEDDPKLGPVLRQGLVEEGYAVDIATDGGTGFDLALASDYDAIILDVLLPKRNGLDLLRGLRDRGSRVPVLMLTARSAVEDRVRGLDAGADDYVAKPFAFSELLARLRALLRRPAAAPAIVLREADLELDPSRHVVRRGPDAVDLTAKEFALLEYLLRNKHLVVTRGMILDHVWNMDYDGGSNLVDVYVNYLRHKVDQGREPKLIHTIRGVGYVLRAPGAT